MAIETKSDEGMHFFAKGHLTRSGLLKNLSNLKNHNTFLVYIWEVAFLTVNADSAIVLGSSPASFGTVGTGVDKAVLNKIIHRKRQNCCSSKFNGKTTCSTK